MEVAADCATLLGLGMAGCYTQVFALYSDLIRQVAGLIRQGSLCNACVQYTERLVVSRLYSTFFTLSFASLHLHTVVDGLLSFNLYN